METKQPEEVYLGVTIDARGRVLLIERQKPEAGKCNALLRWAFPGGRQEAQESPKECVAREIRKETGHHVIVGRLIDTWKHPDFPEKCIWYFLCRPLARGQDEIEERHEVKQARWIPAAEVPTLVTSRLNPKVAKLLAGVAANVSGRSRLRKKPKCVRLKRACRTAQRR